MTDTTQTTQAAGPVVTARAWLARILTGIISSHSVLEGWTVCQYMPELINPPVLIITESDPLMDFTNETTGAATVNLEIAVIARGQANPDTFPALDGAVDALVTGLYPVCRLSLTSYSTVTTPDQTKYLAARIGVAIHLNI